jgi:hypothetical protein
MLMKEPEILHFGTLLFRKYEISGTNFDETIFKNVLFHP